MAELLLIAVGAATVNNFVLVRFLGLCPLLGVGSRLDSAAGMSLATGFVLTVTAGLGANVRALARKGSRGATLFTAQQPSGSVRWTSAPRSAKNASRVVVGDRTRTSSERREASASR